MQLNITETDKKTYHKYLDMLHKDKRKYISEQVPGDEYYLAEKEETKEIVGGVALKKLQNDMVQINGLFCIRQNRCGGDILEWVKQENPDKVLRLFCFGDELVKFYIKHGFYEILMLENRNERVDEDWYHEFICENDVVDEQEKHKIWLQVEEFELYAKNDKRDIVWYDITEMPREVIPHYIERIEQMGNFQQVRYNCTIINEDTDFANIFRPDQKLTYDDLVDFVSNWENDLV